MDEAWISVIVLSVCVLALIAALILTNRSLLRFNAKCLTHALGWSSDQRELMRIQGDADRQEFMLRELREAQGKTGRFGPRPVPAPEGMPDISVDLTGTNTLN